MHIIYSARAARQLRAARHLRTAPEGGGGQGGTPSSNPQGGGTPAGEPGKGGEDAGTPPGGQAAGQPSGQPSQQGGEPGGEPKTFDQAAVDKIVADRVARERRRVEGEFKPQLDELAKIKAENQTESEKALAAARKEGADAVTAKVNAQLVSAEARAVAAELNFRNPALAVRSVDLVGVSVADDGTVDTEAIKATLTTLATDEPYLVKAANEPSQQQRQQPAPDPSQGGGHGTPAPGARGRAEAERRGYVKPVGTTATTQQ